MPSNSSRAFALMLGMFGAWLVYAAVTNQAPIKTLADIAAHPDQTATILKRKSHTLGVEPKGKAIGTVSGNSTGGASIVSFARSKIGQPYVFGGHSDSVGWDCSGLVMEALKTIGISVPHSATAQLLDPRGRKVTKAELLPGDLVFPNLPPLAGDHVQIYSGDGKIIEAPKPGAKVVERPMWGFYTARRYWNETPSASGGGGR